MASLSPFPYILTSTWTPVSEVQLVGEGVLLSGLHVQRAAEKKQAVTELFGGEAAAFETPVMLVGSVTGLVLCHQLVRSVRGALVG